MTLITNVAASQADEILAERTLRLRNPPHLAAEALTDLRSYLCINVGGERFALPLNMAVAIVRAGTLAPFHIADQAVIGAIYERGEVWLVFCFAKLIGQDTPVGSGVVVCLRGATRNVAILVEGSVEQIRLGSDEFRTSTQLADGSISVRMRDDGLKLIDEDALLERLDLWRSER